MILNRFLSRIASYIKKDNFVIDEAVGDAYLAGMVLDYALNLVRGMVRLKSLVLIGKRVKLCSVKDFRFGRSMNIGDDCVINALSREGIVLGDSVSIQKRTIIECTGSIRFLGRGLVVGNNVGIGSNSFMGCAGGIKIGNDTIIGNFVSLHSEQHNYLDPSIPIREQGVSHLGIEIGAGCWIGAKVTVLDGAVIEDGCIIAAGALVTQGRYLANAIYGGVPARFIKYRFAQ